MKTRWFLILGLCLTLAGAARADWTLATRDVVATLPGGEEFIEREARQGDSAVRVQGVFFNEKQAHFAVIDNPSRGSLGEAMAKAGALAGTNGGYFHADGTPVGLEIASGAKAHAFERAKLLSGVFVVTKGRPRLVRSAAYESVKADSDALQAGPFLVDGGCPVTGLNNVRLALRTVVATDGAGRWALLWLSHCTLADAGAVLASREVFPDFRIARALNLDGGSSTGLWVATSPKPFYLREMGRVRNFLAVLPR
jgi:hypothetical protein